MQNDRYHRQTLLPGIGTAGQARLAQARALLVGCGALGSTIAEQLVRAGVGSLRIADRDIVELTNLQRQVLFDESDAREGAPKAAAAARRLRAINSAVAIEPHIVDVDADNVESLFEGIDVALDGTDNVATRYLLNDVSVKTGLPWIYGACVGTEGRVMTIRPKLGGACLRCIFPEPPAPQDLPTCDTAGVLGPVASVVGNMQAIAAIKLLSGNEKAVADELLVFDLWNNRIKTISTAGARRSDCPTCSGRQFTFLESAQRELSARLCGRDAVQVRPSGGSARIHLPELAEKLTSAGLNVQASPFLVRFQLADGGLSLTVFEDGRTLVQGTSDVARARSLVARYIGS